MASRVVIVGAGIVGLAHARAAARRGHEVVVCERHAGSYGASIRNFGMIWPIGQPPGARYQTALRSRAVWQEVADDSDLWLNACGSLHLAYAADEWEVLDEFASSAKGHGYGCRLVSAAEVERLTPAARTDGLRGGLYSSTELGVNPRQAMAVIPAWLQERHGVGFRFGTFVSHVDESDVVTSTGERLPFDRLVVCTGSDFEALYPDVFAGSPLVRCKLQMMQTVAQPAGWQSGPHLAGGLTLRHYGNFSHCRSLEALKQRIAQQTPELDRYGIHVMASQNERGEMILGDSHEYDADIEPFDKHEIDELILRELRQLVELPHWEISRRWHGVYSKHPAEAAFVHSPTPGVTICTGLGGAGMTMSFGLAEDLWDSWET